MKLDWMGDYRDIVEQLIKYCNNYVSLYNKEDYLGTDVEISYSQVQVLEYILENEDLNQNMSMIALRLGISISNFSKLVEKLVKKNLLEKFHVQGNKKNIIIKATTFGRQQYQEYSKYTYEKSFKKMFQAGDEIPRKYLPAIANMLRMGLDSDSETKDIEGVDSSPKLIPISSERTED